MLFDRKSVVHCGWTVVPRGTPAQEPHSDLFAAGDVPPRGVPLRGVGWNLFTKPDPATMVVTTLFADRARKG
eukprot:gene15612-5954_t